MKNTHLRTICHLLAVIPAALLLTCCQNDVQDEKSATDFANLTIAVNSPSISVDSRNVSLDDPDGNADDMSEWDKYVDGRKLYRVTLLLINKKTNAIVGYRDSKDGSDGGITIAGDGKTATASFEYMHPKHGDIEILEHGEYRMIVVANYSGIEAVDNAGTTKSHAGNSEVMEYIDNIKKKFPTDKGLPTSSTDFPKLYNTKISSSNDYVCPQQPQVLTIVKDLQLQPGDNSVSAKLVRTYSRIRIEAANHSEEELSITNLLFSKNFAQKEAYIFDDPDNSGRKYSITAKGAPAVGSTNAIIPFNGTVKIPHIAHTESNRKAVFDAYILESKDETNRYTYTITAGYKDIPNKTATFELRDIHPTTGNVEDLTEIKRNDFIRSLVSISYSPSTIDFEFKVLPWTTKDEEIEYN